jgi:hypothetical protein
MDSQIEARDAKRGPGAKAAVAMVTFFLGLALVFVACSPDWPEAKGGSGGATNGEGREDCFGRPWGGRRMDEAASSHRPYALA